MNNFILQGKTPVAEPGLLKWAKWFETADRTVRRDTVGEVCVSTVFLGLDHSFGKGPPLLFESMIFGGPLDQEQDRCSTWEEAEKMHEKMMERVRSAAKGQ